MKFFNEINELNGGSLDHYHVVDVILNKDCVEEQYTMPSGDVVKFTKEGVFSEKGIFAQDDNDFMIRNPSFQVQDFYHFFQDRGISTAIWITYYD